MFDGMWLLAIIRKSSSRWLFFLCLALNGKCVLSIVGGKNTSIQSAPYMASFMLEGKHSCGAAIINEWWCVTAAHCILAAQTQSDSEVQVRVGSDVRDEGGSVHKVSSLIRHEKYNEQNNDCDIGLFKVSEPFVFDERTKPVKLPPKNGPVKTDFGTVCGWGSVSKSDVNVKLAKKLEYATLPKVSRENCISDYRGKYPVMKSHVCYGYRDGRKDACKGDSGGPLINEDNVLIGISSWGEGCAEPFLPGVYTDVILMMPWIESKIHSSSKSQN